MGIDYELLRILVMRKFPTKRQFGEYMGWNAPKVTRILNGYQFPTIEEVWRLAEACGMSDYDITKTFFART